MFNNIYIEKDILDLPYTKSILKRFKNNNQIIINEYTDIWGKVKKPYLQKRDNLNLFLARKKGQLIKEAPDAYGLGGDKHYYFIHAYNCIYECEYCYLQGYFNSPDIVLFVNHNEIIEQMAEIIKTNPDCWFHAGEFSDSLALTNLTGELEEYFNFFHKHKNAKLELRSKSTNISSLLKLEPSPNIIISFSISSDASSKQFDHKCPISSKRIDAIKKLINHGHRVGIHFDPIIYTKDFELEYSEIIQKLTEVVPNNQLEYISIGVVRFTKESLHQFEYNYPESQIFQQEFIKSFDNKYRYNRPMRMWIMQTLKERLINNYDSDKIYLCME